MKNIISVFLIALGFFPVAKAAETYSEIQASWEKWREGQFENVAFARPGQGLVLGQSLNLFAEFDDLIIWKALMEDSGELLISTGGDKGRLWRVSEAGKKEMIFESQEAFIHSLAKGPKGEFYFSTSPHGAIYTLKPGKAVELFAQLPVDFIWDMKVNEAGELYVATGHPAHIFKLTANHTLETAPFSLFSAKDASAFSTLALGASGRVYTSTGNTGVLYCISKDGKEAILASMHAEEITAIAPQADGSVYFTTYHEDSEPTNPLEVLTAAIQSSSNAIQTAQAPDQGVDQERGSSRMGSGNTKLTFGALYRVDPSGFVEGVWGVKESGLLSLLSLEDGFYLGTSARGKVFRVENSYTWRLLGQLPTEGAISDLVQKNKQIAYICSSNPARIYSLTPTNAKEGSFISTVFDAEQVARFGAAYGVTDPLESTQDLHLESRSGNIKNPDASWSPWVGSSWGERLACPNARYFQYKISWSGQTPAALSSFRFFYTYPNRPPIVRNARVSLLGVQVHVHDVLANRPLELKNFLQEGGLDVPTDVAATRRLEMRATGEIGFMTCAWDAEDPNGDALSFNVELQPIGAQDWVTLVSDLTEPIHSFNVRGLEDGYYHLRIQASDALSNRPQDAQVSSFVTAPFAIDTVAPLVKLVDKKREAEYVRLQFFAEDAFSPLWSARYSLDGDIPRSITPDDGLFDGLKKTFTLEFKDLANCPHSLVFSVQDEWGNTASCTAAW